MLRESPAEDEEVTGSAANLIPEPEPEKTPEPRELETEVDDVTGSAANLIPEPEPEKTPEPRELETENDVEQEGKDDEPAEINTPTRRQRKHETRGEEEMPEEINSPPQQITNTVNSNANVGVLRPLDGSTATDDTRRKSSRISVPTDRYCAEFKLPKNPRSRKIARSSVKPSLKSLKAALKESWAQRPHTTAPLRRRSRSRESARSTRTRAASLERVQTGSIKTSSSLKSSFRTKYEVANQGSFVRGADDSSWSDTEDEADRSSGKVKEGINTISGQKSRIAKVKNSVTLHPGQGAWVYLAEEPEQIDGDNFIFPILFNTIVEKNLFASKFSPRAGMLRSPAIYMINHNNDIFVQVKKGESMGKLISLMVKNENKQINTRVGGVQE